MPCLVGLTGGLASGKSTVAVLLGRRDVPVFDADAAVHRLYRSGGAGAAAVAEAFGNDVLTGEGAVNRDALAGRVIGDDDAMGLLNGVIHPLVRQEVAAWAAALKESIAVVEAALLVETGSFRDYAALIVVWCSPEQQLKRALARGMDESRARGLLVSQLPMAAKREVADVVIDNSGPAEGLPQAVDRAWAEVRRVCADRQRGSRKEREQPKGATRATRSDTRRSSAPRTRSAPGCPRGFRTSGRLRRE